MVTILNVECLYEVNYSQTYFISDHVYTDGHLCAISVHLQDWA